MQKITWPKRSEVISQFFITLFGMILLVIFFFFVDYFVEYLINYIYS